MTLNPAVLLVVAAAPAFGVPAPWTLRLLPSSRYPEALCLDGTRPGYYFRPGDTDFFKLHLQGGNWCRNPGDCLQRSRSFLGSSAQWPASPLNDTWAPGYNMGIDGLMSQTEGPLHTWSAVWVMYCDGSSFTSYLEEPLLVNGTHLHMRGRKILDAVFDDLITMRGLAQAKTVLLSGTSSGGMAVFYHADYVRARLPAAVRLFAAPDAGFFPDAPLPPGQRAFREALEQLVQFYNISASESGYPGVNAHCMAAHGE